MIKAVFAHFWAHLVAPLGYWRQLWAGFIEGANDLLSPTAIIKYRAMWIAFELVLCIIGAVFWGFLWLGADAFAPEVYGAWACSLPALGWAAVQFGASALIIHGLMRPITHWPALVGAMLHAAQYQAIAMSSVLTGGQIAIAIYPIFLFAPAHFVLAVGVWRHGRGR
jgi:hypothetical protein